jgi:hypothetical protein
LIGMGQGVRKSGAFGGFFCSFDYYLFLKGPESTGAIA